MARLFDDGSNEYLEIDSTPISGYPFSISAWVYTDDVTANQCAVFIGDKDSDDQRHGLNVRGGDGGDPIDAITQQGGSYQSAATVTGVSVNTWHHACGVWAAANDRAAFIDGGSKGTNAVAVTPTDIDRISIARVGRSTPVDYFSGRICEVAVWDIALTDAEVATLAEGYSPLMVHPQNLVFYAPLIRDEDQDRVGGLILTAVNTPSIAEHTPVIYFGGSLIASPAAVAPPSLSIPVAMASYRRRREKN